MSHAERALKSIAFMLGWMNVPPQETLERDLNALLARLARAEGERDEALALLSQTKMDANIAVLTALAREAALREALKGMLLSMDAGWELDRAGHDWPEACEAARAALRVEVAPAEEAP